LVDRLHQTQHHAMRHSSLYKQVLRSFGLMQRKIQV